VNQAEDSWMFPAQADAAWAREPDLSGLFKLRNLQNNRKNVLNFKVVSRLLTLVDELFLRALLLTLTMQLYPCIN